MANVPERLALMSDNILNELEFVDEQERIYFAQAQLGQQTIAFLRSPTGRYLHGRAKQTVEEAGIAALACDTDTPEGLKALRDIQRGAAAASALVKWCTEVITEGEMAAAELESYRG